MKLSYTHSSLSASKFTQLLVPYLLQQLQKVSNLQSTPLHILEVGAGNGYISNLLSIHGYEVTALEPSYDGASLISSAYPDLHLINSTVESISPPLKDQYDVVVCIEVIEHVYDPKVFVATLYQALRQGGTLIISTPYHGYIKNLLIALFDLSDQHYTVLWDHGHIKFFSIKTLSQLLTQKGFKDITVKRMGRIFKSIAASMVLTAAKP